MNSLDRLRELTDKLSDKDQDLKRTIEILESFVVNCIKKGCPHALEALRTKQVSLPIELSVEVEEANE